MTERFGKRGSGIPDPIPPTADENGTERHPAFGVLGASRVSQSPPGAVLFDSDIRHQHYVVVRLHQAQRTRDLHRDHVMADRHVVEVAMSEAQWASFVSSMNTGDGVPVTITARADADGYHVPGLPYDSRLKATADEVATAAADATRAIADAFGVYETHKTAGNLRALKYAISNAPSNMRFAADSLTEHAENVVQKARADLEAMVTAKARQLGIEPGDVGVEPAQLAAGDDR